MGKVLGKKGLFKKVSADIENAERFESQITKRRYRSRSRKPLSINYSVTNSSRDIPSMSCFTTCAKAIEDETLREAKQRSRERSVQLYNKGPYGILTPLLAAEMAAGENRRRS